MEDHQVVDHVSERAFPWLFHGFPMVFPRDPSVPTRPNPSQAVPTRPPASAGSTREAQ